MLDKRSPALPGPGKLSVGRDIGRSNPGMPRKIKGYMWCMPGILALGR